MCDVEDGSAIVPSPPFGRTTPASVADHTLHKDHMGGDWLRFPISYMNTAARPREGETIEGSRTMRNRPYPELKCSSRGVRFFIFLII